MDNPAKIKFIVVVKAILFGAEVFNAPTASLKSIWSIPKFKLKTYSIRVRNPIIITIKANNCATRWLCILILFVCTNQRENPINRKAKPVLDLIVENPDPGVNKIWILNCHPMRIRIPIKAIKIDTNSEYPFSKFDLPVINSDIILTLLKKNIFSYLILIYIKTYNN